MAPSPIPVFVPVLALLAFMGLLFGEEIGEEGFPSYERPDSGGLLGVVEAVGGVLQMIWDVIVFFFNLVTVNIPGTPWFIRLIVGSIIGGTLTWSIATLIRGN